MSGEKLAMSKQAAIAAVKTLGERDQVGVIAFDGQYEWIVPLLRVGDNSRAVTRIATIGNGGGTNLMPGMQEGYRALSKVDAAIKHMIVLTDGRTEGTGYPELAAKMRERRITTSAVAVGDDADLDLMDHVAIGGGGKFYKVDNPRMIPRIFMKEAMRVSRSVIFEKAEGFQPVVHYPHEIVSGLTGPLPPLTGFVRTTLKTNPLVEQVLVAPVDAEEQNSTVLATWPYGLGRAVAFTTDDGARWATQWTAWPDYDKFFSQLVRWSMRPVNDAGKFTIATDVEGNRVKVFVTALDAQDEFLNFLNLTGSVVGPDSEPREIKLEQISPGRYVGDFEANETGSYFAMLSPGPGLSPVRAGINVPYSAEFREREGNVALLESMAELAPPGGRPGLVMQGTLSDPRGMAKLMDVDSFRRDLPPAARRQGVWHLLVFAAGCLFFFDIFLRRVAVSFSCGAARRGPGARLAVATQAGRATDRIHGPPAQPQGRDCRAPGATACWRQVRVVDRSAYEHRGPRTRTTPPGRARAPAGLGGDRRRTSAGRELHRPALEGQEKSVGRARETCRLSAEQSRVSPILG